MSNKNENRQIPLSFLVVEDTEETLELLIRKIQREFPDVDLESTGTSEEACKLIQQKEQDPLHGKYDCIIQDILIPRKNIGDNPGIDNSIWDEIQHRDMETYVIYITGYPNDRPVIEKLGRGCYEKSATQMFEIIPKTLSMEGGVTWADQVIKSLYENVIYPKIDQSGIPSRFDEIFPEMDSEKYVQSRFRAATSRGHRKILELYWLCRELECNWHYLDQKFKNRIKKHLNVEETDDKVIVGCS